MLPSAALGATDIREPKMKQTTLREEDYDVVYERDAYMSPPSATWHSYERGLRLGDMRIINGVISRVVWVDKRFLAKDKVSWAPVELKLFREIAVEKS